MKNEWRRAAAALSLVCGAVAFLVGCGSDRPTELGPGVVTPAATRTDQPARTDDPPTSEVEGPQTPDANDPQAGCGPNARNPPSGGGAPAVPAPFRDDQAELDVDGQTGDGRHVVVEEVQLSRTDGYVAICTLDENRLLGVAMIAKSEDDRSARITLDEAITSTTRLVAILYADNRDGRFSWATDPRVSGDDDDITDLEVERFTYRVR